MNPDVRLLLPIFLVAIALIAPTTAYTLDTMTVIFPDVGQGDSVLVQTPNGHAMLVDADVAWAVSVVTTALAGHFNRR